MSNFELRCKSSGFAGNEQEKSLDRFDHQDYQIYQRFEKRNRLCLRMEKLSYLLHVCFHVFIERGGFFILVVKMSWFAVLKACDGLYPGHDNLAVEISIYIA